MSVTTDEFDVRLTHDVDAVPVKQAEVYLVLSAESRANGFVRPVRKTYFHTTCSTSTTMGQDIAETYAREPKFYSGTYCVNCQKHLLVKEFKWEDGTIVGS